MEKSMTWKRLLAFVLAVPLIGTAMAARNGSGTYNVPNVFAPGQTISSSAENANFSDIGNEITNSLPRDGQAGMNGQFKAIDGTLTQPSISFNNETQTGFRRAGTNDMRLVVGGVDILQFTPSGMTSLVDGGGLVPVGAEFDWPVATPPTGYLLEAGQCFSTATYPKLYAVIGTTYNSACPAGQYQLPDKRGRVVAGVDNMTGSAAGRVTTAGSGVNGSVVGSVGGAQNLTIAQTNLPAVSPTFTGRSTTGNVSVTSDNGAIVVGGTHNAGLQSGSSTVTVLDSGSTIARPTATGTFTPQGDISALGSGTALASLPPVIIQYKIIKAY